MAAPINGLAALPNAIISRPNYIPRDWGGRSTYLARTVCGSIAPTAKTTVRRLVPAQPIDRGERI
jgi:hypothetical protein